MKGIQDVAIVGGGIGGLALAGLLQQAGLRTRVYEQAPQLGEIGAGLGLWSQAVKVMGRLKLADGVEAVGMPMVHLEISARNGRVLKYLNVRELLEREHISEPSYIIHRGELHQLLVRAVDPSSIETGMRCLRVEPDAGGATIHFAESAPVHADLVVGADGLRSVVRSSLFGEEKPRYAGEPCFRGVAHVRPTHPEYLREVQGEGKRVGICPLDLERVYWWATVPAPEGEIVPVQQRQAYLLEHFRDWPHDMPELIRQTPTESILVHGLYDRPPLKTWNRGAVTLLGDAAHPTTPNLGMGACMALEDAACLADAILGIPDLASALAAYQKERLKRTAKVVWLSRVWGSFGQWSSPLACWAREVLFQAMPGAFFVNNLLEQIANEPGLKLEARR